MNSLVQHEDDPIFDTEMCQQFEEMSLNIQKIRADDQAFVRCEGKDEKEMTGMDSIAGEKSKVSKIALKQRKRRMRHQDLVKSIDTERQKRSLSRVQGMSLVTEYEGLPSTFRRSRLRRDNKRLGVLEETNLKNLKSITWKRIDQSHKVPTKLVPLTNFKVQNAAWEGLDDNLRFKSNYTLKELEGMGMEIIQWNGV